MVGNIYSPLDLAVEQDGINSMCSIALNCLPTSANDFTLSRCKYLIQWPRHVVEI